MDVFIIMGDIATIISIIYGYIKNLILLCILVIENIPNRQGMLTILSLELITKIQLLREIFLLKSDF